MATSGSIDSGPGYDSRSAVTQSMWKADPSSSAHSTSTSNARSRTESWRVAPRTYAAARRTSA